MLSEGLLALVRHSYQSERLGESALSQLVLYSIVGQVARLWESHANFVLFSHHSGSLDDVSLVQCILY
jgi:hypothetical protein